MGSGDRPPDGREEGPAGSKAPIVLGEFELRREIGYGGMGTVYESWQRSLQRTVAVKVLSRQVGSSPAAVRRFQREAQAAAKLHHPHIVPIFALGEHEGVLYYAMELVDGPSLNAIIAQQRTRQVADTAASDLAETVALNPARQTDGSGEDLAATRALGNGTQIGDSGILLGGASQVTTSEEYFASVARHIAAIADALDYAHLHGVIHRDIKPHNLLLGADGTLRLSDFGLARLSEQPGVTMTGELVGSPLYMSPEQISGDPSKVDQRTDVYSLGATLYEWLTLAPPYPGETRERVISQILTSDPVPPRTHNAAIPVDLETVCLRAMERDPKRRYQCAGDMRDDLRRFLDRQPVHARRLGLVRKTRKLVRRHPVAAMAVLGLVLAGALGVALVVKQREVSDQTAAAQQDQDRVEKLVDLISMLPLEIGGPIRVAEAAAPMLEGVVRGERVQTPVGTIPDSLTETQGPNPETVRSADAIARRAVWDFFLAVAPPHWPDEPAEQGTETPSAVLSRAWSRRETEPAVAAELAAAYVDDHPGDVNAKLFYGALLSRLDRKDEFSRLSGATLDAWSEKGAAYVWRGLAHLRSGEPAGCLTDADRALAAGGPVEWILTIRGLALAKLGRLPEAISAFDEVLERNRDSVLALLGRAAGRAALGNTHGAIVDLSRVLRIEPDNADVLALRGDYYLELEDYASAEQDFAQAMNIGGQSLSVGLKYFSAVYQQRHSAASESPPQVGSGEQAGGKSEALKSSGQSSILWRQDRFSVPTSRQRATFTRARDTMPASVIYPPLALH